MRLPCSLQCRGKAYSIVLICEDTKMSFLAIYILHHTPLTIRNLVNIFITRFISTTKTSIISLFLRSCPSTIIGFIITVIIYPVKCVLQTWSSTHILKEVVKSFAAQPSTRNPYPSTAVVLVGHNSRVATAILHTLVYPVFSSFRAIIVASKRSITVSLDSCNMHATSFVGFIFSLLASFFNANHRDSLLYGGT